MTDKQIIDDRGSAKPDTTLNTIKIMLENEKLKSENKHLNDLLNQALKELEELQ